VSRTDDTAVPDYASMGRLDGLGYLVVGAGQGMGRQSSHALAQSGARVFCVDLDEGLAKDVAGEVGGIAWSGDATKRAEVERMVADATAALGRIDGFVDILGIARYAGVLELDDETWDFEFDMCLRHAYLVSQIAGRAMKEHGQGGTMTFICSVSGNTSALNHGAYGAAKAGLISWIQTLAEELGPYGIRANGVSPGMTWTPRVSQHAGEKGKAALSAVAPLGRPALPADIASVVLFLSTDRSAYVTGQTIVADGGLGIKNPYPVF
jgi:NAD(P)-dependent dehydrogenase (short-subunit alcohol dehydrogenase family)